MMTRASTLVTIVTQAGTVWADRPAWVVVPIGSGTGTDTVWIEVSYWDDDAS